jgi:hypothetical protein
VTSPESSCILLNTCAITFRNLPTLAEADADERLLACLSTALLCADVPSMVALTITQNTSSRNCMGKSAHVLKTYNNLVENMKAQK